MNPLRSLTSSPKPSPRHGILNQRLRRHPRMRGLRRRLDTESSEKTLKHRRLINGHLRRMSHAVGKDLTLGVEGICYFQFKKFIIVIEVPDDDSDCYFIYTMVCQLGSPEDNRADVLQAAMRLNYMQQGTRGACLGLEDDEVNLCYSAPVNSVCRDDFVRSLEDFLTTAEEMNQNLDHVKTHTPKKINLP
mmetsp:Transcript_10369/g.17421  ORF Transcript_10369/g.17421 Transcript_10369/m.17421 type:complete len:190 (+) Transcript_10369:1159-1728(+)